MGGSSPAPADRADAADEARGKYFKVEKSHTAPPSAAWSADAVRKRRADEGARKEARHRAHLVRNHIKRSALRRDVLSGGLASRETEAARVALGPGYGGRAEDTDLGGAAWAAGAVDKGHVPFAPSFARARAANMPCFYVGGEDCKTGLGVAYASECEARRVAVAEPALTTRGRGGRGRAALDEETLVGSYISTDDNDR